MNDYKTLISTILLTLSCVFIISLIGCKRETPIESVKIESRRIKFIESTNQYDIIKVDSIEYLINYHGGIIQLPKP